MKNRQLIIDILGREWPLSAKRIYSHLKKQYRVAVAYHTIYEMIQDMVDKKQIRKIDREYLLNIDWLKQSYERTKQTLENYETNKPLKLISKDTSQIKVFSVQELHKFIIESIANGFFGKVEKFFMRCNHMWGSLYTKEQKIILAKAFKKGACVLCKDNSLLDKEISKFYKSLGAKVQFNKTIEPNPDIIVMNDCVIQVFFPENLIEKAAKIYEKISLKNLRLIKELFEKEAEIDIIITRNNKISNRFKKQIVKASE